MRKLERRKKELENWIAPVKKRYLSGKPTSPVALSRLPGLEVEYAKVLHELRALKGAKQVAHSPDIVDRKVNLRPELEPWKEPLRTALAKKRIETEGWSRHQFQGKLNYTNLERRALFHHAIAFPVASDDPGSDQLPLNAALCQSFQRLQGAAGRAANKTTDYLGQKALGEKPGWFIGTKGAEEQAEIVDFITSLNPIWGGGQFAASMSGFADDVESNGWESAFGRFKDSFLHSIDVTDPNATPIQKATRLASILLIAQQLGKAGGKARILVTDAKLASSLSRDLRITPKEAWQAVQSAKSAQELILKSRGRSSTKPDLAEGAAHHLAPGALKPGRQGTKPGTKLGSAGTEPSAYSKASEGKPLDRARPDEGTPYGGKEQIVQSMERERTNGNAFENPAVYRKAMQFITSMRPEYLEQLNIKIVDTIMDRSGKLDPEIKGKHNPFTNTAELSRRHRDELHRTLVHEVTHHLMAFLTRSEVELLERQFEREKARDRWRAGERRYEDFSEWVADSVMDHIERTRFRKADTDSIANPLTRVRSKIWASATGLGELIYRRYLRGTRRDYVAEVFEKLLIEDRSAFVNAGNASIKGQTPSVKLPKVRKYSGLESPGNRRYIRDLFRLGPDDGLDEYIENSRRIDLDKKE